MAVSLIPVLIILGIVVLVVAGAVVLGRRRERAVDQAVGPGAPTLRYQVPEGQDPLAVTRALNEEGYDAVADGDHVVVRGGEDPDRERAHVRAVIARAPVDLDSDVVPGHRVRFEDE